MSRIDGYPWERQRVTAIPGNVHTRSASHIEKAEQQKNNVAIHPTAVLTSAQEQVLICDSPWMAASLVAVQAVCWAGCAGASGLDFLPNRGPRLS